MLNQAATLTGFKVYKWNERLPFNNISAHQGLFIIRRGQDKLIWRFLPFNLDNMVMCPSDIDGYFVPHPEGLNFFMALSNSQLFMDRVVMELAREINLFLLSCFRFEEFTICCYPSSRLVFVADISYIEAWRFGHAYVGLAGDVNYSYADEMVEILEALRMFCNTTRTSPTEPLSPHEPLGLMEEERNLDISVFKELEEPYLCSICLDPLEVGVVVLKTRCGHVYHKKCSLPWFSSEFKCPMCRPSTINIL